jgi:hypothetical protein
MEMAGGDTKPTTCMSHACLHPSPHKASLCCWDTGRERDIVVSQERLLWPLALDFVFREDLLQCLRQGAVCPSAIQDPSGLKPLASVCSPCPGTATGHLVPAGQATPHTVR